MLHRDSADLLLPPGPDVRHCTRMATPKYQLGDRVRVIRTSIPNYALVGVVREIDTKTIGSQTKLGPRYRLVFNGIVEQWVHELHLAPAESQIRAS